MTVVEGRDVSELNGRLAPAWYRQFGFVIVRAFNEVGRMDRDLDYNLGASVGVTWRGVYGWPIRGADNRSLGRSLGVVAEGLELGAWADYEHPPHGGLASPAELADYLSGIETVGVRAGFYSNRSEYPSSFVLDRFAWWYANPSGLGAPRPPAIVQYGIIDGVDADRATQASLEALSGLVPAPDPVEVSEVETVVFGQQNGAQVAYLCQGGRAIVTWREAPFQFGCPQKAVDYVNGHPGVSLVLATPADLDRISR